MRFHPYPAAARASSAAVLAAAVFVIAGCSRPAGAGTTAAATPPAPAPASGAAPAAPATAQFKFATQTLTVPAGFTVELVAAPPMVNRPISVALDPQGRLYATDSSGLSDRAPVQFEQKPHRIVRLEDKDGDGRYDASTVFADKMMFPQGAMFHEGSLYVSAPPHIWKLTDADGDGVAEKREVWWDGKTLTGCANDVHGPYFGPDGWFYWTKGAFAEQKHTVNGREFVTHAAHIYRARPDGSRFEPVLTGGMDNPVGIAFTPTGERVLCGTFFQIGVAGKRDGLIHSIYGGVYGKENAAAAGHPRTGDLMPVMTHMGAAAPCGTTAYRSRVFGADYQDNVFVCYFNLRKISRHQLVPDGATFKTIDSDFVTSDSFDFHPTDVLEDADGSLLIVDTGGWYKICCPTSQLAKPDVLGAIYRIRRTGVPKVEDARGLNQKWETLATADLVKLLADERPYVCERAQEFLGRQGAAAVPALQDAALKSPSAVVRRNALWTLTRIDDTAARAAVRAAVADRDPAIANVALQAMSLWRDREPASDHVADFIAGKQPALIRAAAEAAGRNGAADAVQPLLAAASRLGETTFTATGTPENPAARALEHAIIYALIELNRRDEVFAQLKPTANPRLVRVALVALDQMASGGLQPEHVLPWLNSSVAMLRQTAGWIVGNHEDWGGALAEHFRGRLAAKSWTDDERADLQTQLARLAKSPAIQELLAATAANTSARTAAREVALRAMAGAGLKETPAAWFGATATLLASDASALVRPAVATAKTFILPKTSPADLCAALGRVGRDGKQPEDLRLDALSVAPASLGRVEPALFDFLRSHLDSKQPMLVRSAAASVLAKAPLAPEQQLTLAAQMKTVGALEAPKLLPAFERGASEALGRELVAALKQSPGLTGLRVNVLKPVFAKYPKPIQEQAAELFTLINADAARQSAHVDELLATAKDGDIRRGQEVFNSPKASCTLCHVMGYRGGRLGPDLTNIGKIRNERDLLEAVVFPSSTFVRGFEPFVVTRKNGEALTGILRKDAADEVVLAIGPESEQHIARSDVVEIQPGAVSPMPPGYEAVLSSQELADLIAFLKSRGT